MNFHRARGKMLRFSRPFLPVFESMEARQLLSTISLLGTSGDDHILISFDSTTGAATVTGAANVANGSVFAKPDRFDINAGDGNDTIEFGSASGVAANYPQSGSNSTVRGGNGNDLAGPSASRHEQMLPKLRFSARKARHDCAHRHAQHIGDLLV